MANEIIKGSGIYQRTGKSNLLVKDKLTSTTNGDLVLSLTPNTIQYDKNMVVESWQNEAEGYKDIEFRANEVDYESAGVGNVIIKGNGITCNSDTNTFLHFDDTNELLLNSNNIIYSFQIKPNTNYTDWVINNNFFLFTIGELFYPPVGGNAFSLLAILRKSSTTQIRVLFRLYSASGNSDGEVFVNIADLVGNDVFSFILEASYVGITVNNKLYKVELYNNTIYDEANYVSIGGLGNGFIDGLCCDDLSIIKVVFHQNTFFDLANKSIGDTIDTGFKPFVPINKYRLKSQNCGYYALTNNSNPETINNTTYINSVKSEQSNIDLIKHASYISPKVVKQGFDFAETGASIYIPSSELIDISTNDFLFQCWVKPNTLHNIFSRGNGLFGLSLSTNTISIANTSISTTVNGIESSEFKHIAIFREGTNAVICVNGIIKSIDTLSDNITGLGDLFIGRYDSSDSTHRFDGLITNVEFNNEDSIYSLGSLSVGDKLFNPPMRNSNRKDR